MKKIIHIALMLCALFLLAQNGASANSSPANDIIRQYNAEQKALKSQLNKGEISSGDFLIKSQESADKAKAAQDALLGQNKTDTTPSGPGSAPENVSYGTIEKDSPSYGNNNYSQPSGPGYDAGSGSSGISSSGSYGYNGGKGSRSSSHYDAEIASIQSNCTRADRCVYEIQEVEDRRAGDPEGNGRTTEPEDQMATSPSSNTGDDRYGAGDDMTGPGMGTGSTYGTISGGGIGGGIGAGLGTDGAGPGLRVTEQGAKEWTKNIQAQVTGQAQKAAQNPGQLAAGGGGSGGSSLFGGALGSLGKIPGFDKVTSIASQLGAGTSDIKNLTSQIPGGLSGINNIGNISNLSKQASGLTSKVTGIANQASTLAGKAKTLTNKIPSFGNLNLGDNKSAVASIETPSGLW